MGILAVPAAKALPAFALDNQSPSVFKASSPLHFHRQGVRVRPWKPKNHTLRGSFFRSSCTFDFHLLCRIRTKNGFSTSLSSHRHGRRPFLAGLIEEFKGTQEEGQERGGFLGRSLRRVSSRIGRGDNPQERLKERSVVTREEPPKRNPENVSLLTFDHVENGDELMYKNVESSNSTTSMKDWLVAAAQKQAGKLKGVVSNSSWTNYITSVDASPGTPLLPFVGNSLIGLGSIIVVSVALVAWWRKFRHATRDFRFRNSEETRPPSTEELRGAQAAVAAPIALSLLLQSGLKKKESAEWLNMVLGKVWNLYRRKLESAFVDTIQPVIDEIPEKPPYVQRVEVKQLFLGDDPVTLRTIERRTSRRANDLQYHIGLRYTGNCRMVFSITLKFGFLPITIPIGIRGLDLDGEVWVKLRLIPTEPWIGTATWAFVSLPKVTLALAPFRLLNLMAYSLQGVLQETQSERLEEHVVRLHLIPQQCDTTQQLDVIQRIKYDMLVKQRFLTKLLTQDVPLLFVRPNKQVINYLKGKFASPVSRDFKEGSLLKGFAGELSITLIEGRKLSYFPIGQTDPYVVFLMGEQVIRSKRNSKTSIIGPPGAPIWNQDFRMLVVDPKTQKLKLRVRDNVGYLGLTTITVGSVEVSLYDLQDTVPADMVLPLQTNWGFFGRRAAGEILVRLTYKAYVEDEEETGIGDKPLTNRLWNEIGTFISKEMQERELPPEKRQPNDRVTISVDAERSEKGFRLSNPLMTESIKKVTRRREGDVVSSSSTSTNGPENPALVENPALKEQEAREDKSWGSQIQIFAEENTALIWLAVVTGVALLVALDLNLTNLFNP